MYEAKHGGSGKDKTQSEDKQNVESSDHPKAEAIIYDLAFDFYSQRFAVSSEDNRIKIFGRSGSSQFKKEVEIDVKGRVRRLSWAPPHFGQVFAAATLDDNVVRIFEETTTSGGDLSFAERRGIKLDSKPTGLAFKPGAEPTLALTLAIPCADGKVYVYEADDAMDLTKWVKVSELSAGKKACTAIAWNPNYMEIPSLVVACGQEQAIWEYYEEQFRWVQASKLGKHNRPIRSLAWAPSMGRSYHLIATASDAVRIYKLKAKTDQLASDGGTGRFEVDTEKDLAGEKNIQIWKVSWNLTGSILASSDAEGKVCLWKRDFEDWKNFYTAKGTDGIAID